MAERFYSGYGAILSTEQVMAKNLLSKDAGRAVKAEVGRRPMWMDGESEGEVGWDGIGRRQESDACFPIWLFIFKVEIYIFVKNKLFSLRMGTGKVLLSCFFFDLVYCFKARIQNGYSLWLTSILIGGSPCHTYCYRFWKSQLPSNISFFLN